MKKLNSNGFGAIETLLVIIVICIIGGVSYYVYTSQKKANTSLGNATNSQTEPQKSEKKSVSPTPVAPDPTLNWTAYSDTTGKFSLRYPTAWVKATRPELCSPGILLLGPTKESVGVCASESFGEVSVVSTDGDTSGSYELKTGYMDVKKEDATVDGVKGIKVIGVAKGQAEAQAIGSLADGTVVVKYIFYTNGKTYIASYIKLADYPDALADFNLLVTKTLTFSK